MQPVEILEDTKEAVDSFKKLGWGGTKFEITKEQVEELLNEKRHLEKGRLIL